MSDIVWEDPPPQETKPTKVRDWVETIVVLVRNHPGKWARVLTDETRSSVSYRQKVLIAEGCEAKVRRTAKDHSLYARWPEATS